MALPLIMAAGMAISAFGAYKSYEAAKETNAAQNRITSLEQKTEAQRKQAMELDTRRKQLEAIRNQQKARAMALTTATSQGASQGSGLQGAYGQFSGDVGTDLLGLSQNLQMNRNIFDINSQISREKMSIADSSTKAAFGAGLSSLGGSIFSAGKSFGS